MNLPLEAARERLAKLPRQQPAVVVDELRALLDHLAASPPAQDAHIALLEEIAPLLSTALAALSSRYHDKPLPLAEPEELQFQTTLAAWQALGKAYAQCLQREESQHPAAPDFPKRMARLLQRRLLCCSQIIIEHYLARRALPPGTWLELHRLYRAAEAGRVNRMVVDTPAPEALPAADCNTLYAKTLLVELASPYSQELRNLNLILRWAGSWAVRVSLGRLSADPAQHPPYLLDLNQDAPLLNRPARPASGEYLRCVDTTALGALIENALAQLRQRISPARLGLGQADDNASQVIRLLEQLRRPWTQKAAARQFRRFNAQGSAHVACGFEAMHFHVTGQAYAQPDIAHTYSRQDYEQLFTFRDHDAPRRRLPAASTPLPLLDEWAVINHSANGFRLTRSSAGQKLSHGQLLAIRPHDGPEFLLARATWLMQAPAARLIAGIALLPGRPLGVGVRMAGLKHDEHNRFQHAFLLPSVPAAREETSLVLPAGMYLASRELDLDLGQDEFWRVRMGNILQRGPGFDRISYSRL